MSNKPDGPADFLGSLPPFDRLPAAERDQALRRLDSLYINASNASELLAQMPEAFYVLYSGVIDVLGPDQEPVHRLERGDFLGPEVGLPLDPTAPGYRPLAVRQDGILYRLSAETLQGLLQRQPQLEAQFADWQIGVPSSPVLEANEADWSQQPISSLGSRPLVAAERDVDIRTAATRMAEASVSCLPILDDGSLCGLITDRDLRNRVLAAGLDPSSPVADIMTPGPVTIRMSEPLFEALALMSQHNIHHLPVLDERDQPVGIVTTTDLLRQQKNAPQIFSKSLHKARDLDSLRIVARELPDQVRSFARNARDAATAGRLVTALTDTLTRRLISLYGEAHGAPPAAYAWLAFGSQGRADQTLYSDQDNGLLLADDPSPQAERWFAGLADYVCDGLAACGIPLCPGNVMAKNPEWRLSREQWAGRFQSWVTEPTPKGVLNSMIFFDSRCVAGNQNLYRRHRRHVAELGQQSRFLAEVAGTVARIPVPLGLFDRLLTESRQGKASIDLKTLGIAVANDLVRLHALQAGLTEPGTLERLQALEKTGQHAHEDLHNLADTWRFLTNLRLHWQLGEHSVADAPNAILPEYLSSLERRQLKAAFRVLKDAQEGAALHYRHGL
ncbi:MAG: DUF294 nucleotidyltransferase-like domain-containing protein [Natronospirillum sp.]|uniref:DUF294 nucleotidyltransferase-like domain-containing protein n=1 Tax=Natronospirillum sp. TaxID=2812955 RepID=UPI0025E90378|nr:DUF294 nucleotidyltransferase-like domain-containing protein [Natronospirillum sp.]MCH8550983.1 DUF294 nucleotidyltransferase-like domain-containing protein [Natronospirillum sp.]